jgi:glycosyltransferase involved in cell wall biosynthesis
MPPVTTSRPTRIESEPSGPKHSWEYVRLLYVCDFPPSNVAGGPILMSRLLQDYPADRIVVLASSRYCKAAPQDSRLTCEHIQFPMTKGWGRWGLGRLKTALEWVLLPVIAMAAAYLIRRRHIDAMVTIPHQLFFIPGAIAAWATGIPYIVIAHDDWVSAAGDSSRVTGWLVEALSRVVLHRAAHIYSVSAEMQHYLKSRFGVNSELQLPATEPSGGGISERAPLGSARAQPVIVYAGSINELVEDSLRFFAEMIRAGKLTESGQPAAQLRVHTFLSGKKLREWGWEHPAISVQPWVSQSELHSALESADLLLLPFSFSESTKYAVERSFPSKTADYLASGRPILVFGPRYSTVVRYAAEQGFAEIVDKCSPDALERGVRKMLSSPAYRSELVAKSLAVFAKNHDIQRQRSEFYSLLGKLVTFRPD